MGDVATRVRQFIVDELLFDAPEASIADDTPLLGGVLDSLGLMELISFFEEDLGVEVDDAEVTAANFRTVADIEGLVTAKSVAR